MSTPVIRAATNILAHTPGLVEHGSKTSRELATDPSLRHVLLANQRTFGDAVSYPPHQAYIGNVHPRDLPPRPHVGVRSPGAERHGPDGELFPEDEFLGLLAAVDEFELITLDPVVAEQAAATLAINPIGKSFALDRIIERAGDVSAAAASPGALTLRLRGGRVAGAIRPAHATDPALTAEVLLENLAGKATGALALARLLHANGIDPLSIDYVIGCSEEAVGDRYQRGGGNIAKAIAGSIGLANASGVDVKDFCAAPIPALVMAAALIASGVFTNVAIVAGGSLPKLGMKFQGHLAHDLPVLEDVLGGTAALLGPDDGRSPRVRLDVVGRQTVDAGSSNQRIVESLTVEPLARVGMTMTDVDDFATELHDPEVTEPQGSGDVAARNYKMMAALAARRGDIDRSEIAAFVTERGMPGFAPTQGHLASAICYLPHALRRLGPEGGAQRALLLAKGSLFLGRMSRGSDGMSVLLERNAEV